MLGSDRRNRRISRPHLWLIRAIGVIVPQRLRADWRLEWEAELRSRETLLADWDKLDRRNKLDLLRRSVGSLWDALCLQPRRLEDEMFQDLRYGARMLLRQRAFTLAAVIALALGIGANTAVFSVVNAVLLRPLPYRNSDRMALIWGNFLTFSMERLRAKAAEYVDYRDQTRSFETVAAFSTDDFNFTGGLQPDRIAGASVTANLFPMLGARAAQGRLISPDENQTGRDNVVVVSHQFWQKRMGAEANVIGRGVILDDRSYTVIGVMPADFEFPHPSFNFAEPVEFWIPLAFTTEQVAQRQRPYYLNVIGLLKPDVTIEQARAEMASLGQRFEKEHQSYRGPKNSDMGWRITVTPLQEQIVGNSRRALLVLFAAVGLVLLIACANVANLFLMRATVRQKEMAIRAAMGAYRLRLIRQLLTESLLIAALGGAGGLILALWGVKALVALGADNLPRLHEINVDWRVLFFTLALSALTGLIFGLAPALQASRPDLQQTLKEGGGAATRGRHWLRNMLVVGEVAIAMTLLVGAGLMLNSFLRLQRVNPVVDSDKLLSVEITLPETRYPEAAQAAAFFQELIRRVESLPGVKSASLSTVQPLSGVAVDDPFCIEGRPLDFNNAPVAGWNLITPNYFGVLGIPIIAGRDFTERDTDESSGAAIINESMARRYFPNEDPIGKRLTLGLPRPDNPWLTIVGIVKDIPHRGLESKAEPDWYLSYLRRPRRDVYLVARTSGDRAPLASAIRSQISAIDKDQPVTAIRTISEVIASTTAPRRFNTLLLAIFAAVALTLAAVGIYSVISYSVTQRAQEVGIRMALGAQSGDVIGLILKQGLTLTLIGVAAGVAGALAAARALTGLLYGVTATDPATFVAISLLLAVVALLACYLPARRAARVEPIAALRCE
ncbi:MAG TPA: ABC transporter permease [Blastocatellia bacterium]|nr:ABC transporter permease [Blastocatellia bacterium]